jgi:hypothetical protein
MREIKGRVFRIRIGFKAGPDPESHTKADPKLDFTILFSFFVNFYLS